MTWYPNLIKYRLFYFSDYKAYVKMWQPREVEFAGVKRKRVSYDPLFVSQALENAMFDECFGRLTPPEQKFLIMLYTDGAEDLSVDEDIKIAHSERGFDSLMKTGLSPKEIWDIVNQALATLVSYLNELEQG